MAARTSCLCFLRVPRWKSEAKRLMTQNLLLACSRRAPCRRPPKQRSSGSGAPTSTVPAAIPPPTPALSRPVPRRYPLRSVLRRLQGAHRPTPPTIPIRLRRPSRRPRARASRSSSEILVITKRPADDHDARSRRDGPQCDEARHRSTATIAPAVASPDMIPHSSATAPMKQ